MVSRIIAFLLASVAAAVFTGTLANGQIGPASVDAAERNSDIGFTEEFFLEDCNFATTGSNRYFVLEPGYRLLLTGEDEGAEVELEITVLDKTKKVDGVTTRVVEERESEDGELVEISRNYFAICEETNSVFYFGEDVDFYEDGKIVNHEGSWLSGKKGAKAGLMMPGLVLINSKYMQEVAPGLAMDRARILSIDEELRTPAGRFDGVLKTWETTPLEPGVNEFKFYAPGIGLIQDKELGLEEHGFK